MHYYSINYGNKIPAPDLAKPTHIIHKRLSFNFFIIISKLLIRNIALVLLPIFEDFVNNIHSLNICI